MSELQLATYVTLATINFGFVAWVGRRSKSVATKRVYALEISPAQLKREKRNAIFTTPIHAALLAFFTESGLMRISSNDGILVFTITFLMTFLWTEIWHYFSHRAMHWKKLHFIHVEHHLSRATNAWTFVSFSFLEKLIFSVGIIGMMAMLSRFIPISFYAIAAYYIFYFYTNTLGHANAEFRPENYSEGLMAVFFNTPSYHAMHHARYTKNYGLITPFLDRFFNTAWSDAGEVQRRAAQGKPLTKLSERA